MKLRRFPIHWTAIVAPSVVAMSLFGCARTEPARDPTPLPSTAGAETLGPDDQRAPTALRPPAAVPPVEERALLGAQAPRAGAEAPARSATIMPPGLGEEGWMAGSVGASVPSHLIVRREQIQWGPGPAILPPGASVAVIEGDPAAAGKLFTLRLRMPHDYRIPPHWHHADEHVTVISGIFRVGMGDSFDVAQMDALSTGGFAVLPARHHHYAMAEGETEIQVHAVGPWKLIYVNPEDDPSRKSVAP
jgi:mannose-6-phosphate isomerase-like protein (cupin superfamily)